MLHQSSVSVWYVGELDPMVAVCGKLCSVRKLAMTLGTAVSEDDKSNVHVPCGPLGLLRKDAA